MYGNGTQVKAAFSASPPSPQICWFTAFRKTLTYKFLILSIPQKRADISEYVALLFCYVEL
jgi:hypothetical protein